MSGDRVKNATDQVAEDTEQNAKIGARSVALIETVVRPLAIAAMMGCIAISLVQFLAMAAPGWPGGAFVALAIGVSLESIHAQRLLDLRKTDSRDRLRFRFVEWVVILLIVRFALYFSYGRERLIQDIAAWSLNAKSFFDITYLIAGALLPVFWYVAALTARTVQEMETSRMELLPSSTDLDGYLRSTMPRHGSVDRTARMSRLVGTFFAGGALMLLFAGLGRVDVHDLMAFSHDASSGIITNVLAYFVLGFLLISQARYTSLKATWEIESIPVLNKLPKRWLSLLLGFLLVLAIVAALLPVSYSVGMIDVLSTAVQWILYVLLQIALTVMFLISYAFGWVLALIFQRDAPVASEMQRMAPPPEIPASTTSTSPEWWQLVSSLIFWTVIIGIVGYSIYHFVVYRTGLLRSLSGKKVWQWLNSLWRRIRRGSAQFRERVRQQIAQRRQRRQQQTARRWRYVSLRRLSPRDRVRYFYVSTLRRGASQGMRRPPSATPSEYAEILARELPESAPDVQELTESFVVARYSEHAIETEKAKSTQSVWTRIKRALLARRRTLRGEPRDYEGQTETSGEQDDHQKEAT